MQTKVEQLEQPVLTQSLVALVALQDYINSFRHNLNPPCHLASTFYPSEEEGIKIHVVEAQAAAGAFKPTLKRIILIIKEVFFFLYI